MSISVEFDRPLVFYISNEHETIARMTERMREHVETRTRAGVGSTGALPLPRDGGRPMVETGRLISSITDVVRISERGRPVGHVFSAGARPDDERAKISFALESARNRTRVLRQRIRSSTAFKIAAAISAKRARALIRASRFRTVTDNASLAAILSVRDAKKPGRVVYRVFEARESEVNDIATIAREHMKVSL